MKLRWTVCRVGPEVLIVSFPKIPCWTLEPGFETTLPKMCLSLLRKPAKGAGCSSWQGELAAAPESLSGALGELPTLGRAAWEKSGALGCRTEKPGPRVARLLSDWYLRAWQPGPTHP